MTAPLTVRFWSRVDKRGPGECWQWTGYTDRQGYGRLMVGGKLLRAHALAWSFALNSEWPQGKIARHTCDNPGCVNPAHIIPGTNAENMRDKNERGRDAGPPTKNRTKTHCDYGHPLSGENLEITPGNGWRQCRICRRRRALQSYHKRRSERRMMEAQ